MRVYAMIQQSDVEQWLAIQKEAGLTLTNSRHEAFAQALALGMSASAACFEAG
jgi:hypothetical protein